MTIEVSWFVANMIGLRALLNEIIRASEIIKSERFGPIGGQYRDFGQDIHDSAHQILEQINTTLDNVERSDGNDQLKREPNGTLPMITLRNELRGSHFLRAQLVAVVGFSEIMMGGMFGPIDEKYRTYAEQINTMEWTHLRKSKTSFDIVRHEVMTSRILGRRLRQQMYLKAFGSVPSEGSPDGNSLGPRFSRRPGAILSASMLWSAARAIGFTDVRYQHRRCLPKRDAYEQIMGRWSRRLAPLLIPFRWPDGR